MGELKAPELLHEDHDLSRFCSGEDSLDHWLIHRALDNQLSGASRTFVLCYTDSFAKKIMAQAEYFKHNQVIAYYCLASGSVMYQQAPGQIKRNMPNPIPVVILGRLAVCVDFQGHGLGRALLKDAVLRTIKLSQEVGVRALLAHALTLSAKAFYEQHGFLVSPLEPMTLMLPLPKHDISVPR